MKFIETLLTFDFKTFDFQLKYLYSPMASKPINKLKQSISFARQRNFPRSNRQLWTFKPAYTLRLLSGKILIFGLLLIFCFTFFISACGLDVEDPTPPSPPVWVQKSLPEEWPERGIDAHESGGIFLEWEPSQDENIAAYLIFGARYYLENDSLGDYQMLGTSALESTKSFSFLHSVIAPRTKYYYKLRAEDFAGNLSVFSDSIGYALLPSLSMETMTPNGVRDTLNSNRLLTWGNSYETEMEDYCLTLLTQSNNLIIRVQFNPTDYVNGRESWKIPESVVLDSNAIYKWRIDLGAQYIDNTETFGSETQWATFLYISN
jgi:hypothetical protein